MHLNTHDYIEYIKRDLMQTIERENESRKAMMRLAVLLHGDSGTLPNYQWTDTPPELLRSSRHTVLVRSTEPTNRLRGKNSRQLISWWPRRMRPWLPLPQEVLQRTTELVNALQELRSQVQHAAGQYTRLRRVLGKQRQLRRPSLERVEPPLPSPTGTSSPRSVGSVNAPPGYRASPYRPRLNSTGNGTGAPASTAAPSHPAGKATGGSQARSGQGAAAYHGDGSINSSPSPLALNHGPLTAFRIPSVGARPPGRPPTRHIAREPQPSMPMARDAIGWGNVPAATAPPPDAPPTGGVQ